MQSNRSFWTPCNIYTIVLLSSRVGGTSKYPPPTPKAPLSFLPVIGVSLAWKTDDHSQAFIETTEYPTQTLKVTIIQNMHVEFLIDLERGKSKGKDEHKLIWRIK